MSEEQEIKVTEETPVTTEEVKTEEVKSEEVPAQEAPAEEQEGKPVGPATVVQDEPAEQFPSHDETISSQ